METDSAETLREDIEGLNTVIDCLLDDGAGPENVTLIAAASVLADRKAKLSALEQGKNPLDEA